MSRRRRYPKKTHKGKSIFWTNDANGNTVYVKQPFESLNYGSCEKGSVKYEPKTTIYDSMMKSRAYQSLSKGAMFLHKVCLMQMFATKKTPVGDYNLDEEEFCISYGLLKKVYPHIFTDDKKICRAKKELIEKGFIEECYNGKTKGQRSIYKMSDRWHTYYPQKSGLGSGESGSPS